MASKMPQAGDVYRIDFGRAKGSEAEEERPAIVMQVPIIRGLDTVLVVPCTKEMRRKSQPTNLAIASNLSGLEHDSVALVHLLSAVSKTAILEGPFGNVGELTLNKLRFIAADLLGIDAETFLGGE